MAGSFHSGGKFHVYRWDGKADEPVKLKVKGLNDFHPEAIIYYPEKGVSELQVLSDDGKLMLNSSSRKSGAALDAKKFRSFWLLTQKP